MKRLIKTILSCILFTLLLAGCSEDLLNEDAPSILTADNLYKDKAGFDAGINGLYNEVRRSRGGARGANYMMTFPAFIGVDNAYQNWRDPAEEMFNNWGAANNASVSHFSDMWAWLYETINAANTIIDRANTTNVLSEADKNQVLAQARFIRAWSYRHLTYLWGDVPLTLEESSGSTIKTDWKRTPMAEVRDAMETDWLFAEQYLPETSSNQGEILKGAVQHYLAELYLAEDNPDKARNYALRVTTNPNYKLVTERYGVNETEPGTAFTDMFIEGNSNRSQGNNEALWVMQAEIGITGGEGNNVMRRYWVNRYYALQVTGTDGIAKNPLLISTENGGRGIGRFAPTKWAFSIYDAADDRGFGFAWRFYWIINNPDGVPSGYDLGDTIYLDTTSIETLSNPAWPSTRKWDSANPLNPNEARQYNDQIYLRSADTYLLLAEANFKLGDTEGAAEAINALRARANAPLVTPGQITLDFLLDERSRELFSEEERRYTLLRNDEWLERTRLYNNIAGPNVTERDKLLPIPQDVIDTNLTLEMPQNPGY